MPGFGVPLQDSERLVDGVGEGVGEREQLVTCPTGEDDAGHESSGSAAELPAKLGEGNRVALLEIGEAGVDGGKRVGVGEDFGGFFERRVLVDGDERGRGLPVAGDDDVLTAVGHLVEQLGEGGAEVSDTDGLRHERSVQYRVHVCQQVVSRLDDTGIDDTGRRDR